MELIPVVSTVIANDEGEVLFVIEKNEKNRDKLNLPGGHLELDETVQEGAIREVKEEVSVDVELTGLLGTYICTKPTGIQHIHFVFTASVTDGIPTANEQEVADIAWHTLEEIYSYPSESLVSPKKLKMILETYKNGTLYSIESVVKLPVRP